MRSVRAAGDARARGGDMGGIVEGLGADAFPIALTLLREARPARIVVRQSISVP